MPQTPRRPQPPDLLLPGRSGGGVTDVLSHQTPRWKAPPARYGAPLPLLLLHLAGVATRPQPTPIVLSRIPAQIAATFKAKINRRRLDKLDIIKICEEILDPSVPTALRPSRILMGEPPLRDYYLAAFLAGFALPSYSNDVSRLLVNLELKVCSAFY
ncbi:hypothetical protein ZWY2020_045053 [Hordeum vulgare]|nr:hypothetical protein ZWY2020_045053 [Hordeum vulgare]